MKTFDQTILVGAGGPTEAGWHQFETFLKCEKEDQFKRIRGITRPQEHLGEPLAIGSLVHAGRAMWFRCGQRTDEKTLLRVNVAIVDETEKLNKPATGDALQKATTYVQEYINHWSMRPQSKPTIKGIEYKLGPALFATSKNPTIEEMRTARLDDFGVYKEASGRLVIGECKTTSGSINDVIKEYTHHGQIMLQQLLWKHAPQGEKKHGPISGTVLDIIVKGYGGKRCQFAREFIPLRPVALANFQRDLLIHLSQFNKASWDSGAPRNHSACFRTYGRMKKHCDYLELCMHGRVATGGFKFADGSSLLTWRPGEGKHNAPWS